METIFKSIGITLGFIASIQTEQSAENIKKKDNEIMPHPTLVNDDYGCPVEITTLIIDNVALANCYKFGRVYNLACINKAWYHFFKTQQPSTLSFYTIPHNTEESYLLKIFYSGALIYKRNDKTKVIKPIAELEDPFNGEFNLSDCDKAARYLAISTGWRTQVKPINVGKVEIFICLRNLMMAARAGSASSYKYSLSHWKTSAPIGIFWNGGEWNRLDDYDFLTSKDITFLSTHDLFKSWYLTTLVIKSSQLFLKSPFSRYNEKRMKFFSNFTSKFYVCFNQKLG